MPNHVKNKIAFFCDREKGREIFRRYNTHIPAEIRRAYDGDIICRKAGEEYSAGWFNDKTGSLIS